MEAQQVPEQTVAVGTRIVTTSDIAYVGGWNRQSHHKGEAGTVVEYAAPEIQTKQLWPWESYYVELDGENGARRLLRREDFTIVPDSL
jgi:hypothetical protein